MAAVNLALTTILERTALMWLSCLSSLSSTSSSSKVTRFALKRDFLGGAGVKDGSWSGRSTEGFKVKPQRYKAEGQATKTGLYLPWWQRPSFVPQPFSLLLLPHLSSCQAFGPLWLHPGHRRPGTALALLGGLPQSLLAEAAATSFLKIH